MSWGIVFRVRQQLKGSLYALPILGALLGPLLGQLTIWLDQSVSLPAAWRYSPSTATGVLSVLVGAMVGLLGFVVTIGVLVVQQATSTLSPRFMRLWYRDLLQKVVLATFAGTLTFSFSLLRHVEDTSVPNLGVTLAGGLVAASLLLLLLYVDRFTHSLRPVAVAATVAGAGRRVVEGLPVLQAEADAPDRPAGPSTPVRAARAGAIQAIDARGLLALARGRDCVLHLPHSVGDFVPNGAVLVEVYGPAPATARASAARCGHGPGSRPRIIPSGGCLWPWPRDSASVPESTSGVDGDMEVRDGRPDRDRVPRRDHRAGGHGRGRPAGAGPGHPARRGGGDRPQPRGQAAGHDQPPRGRGRCHLGDVLGHAVLRPVPGDGGRRRARGPDGQGGEVRDRQGVPGPGPGHAQARHLGLFLVVEKVTPDKAVEGLRQYGGTVLKSSLSKETEAKLQDALHGEGSNA